MRLPPVKIVAFLQNQWFKNPVEAKRLFDRNPERREEYIARLLFWSCKTGKILQSVLGADLCNEILWEETSRHIGGYSSSSFPADLSHMRQVLSKWRPKVVLAFGKTAQDAVEQLPIPKTVKVLKAPHPAARSPLVRAHIGIMKGILLKIISQ